MARRKFTAAIVGLRYHDYRWVGGSRISASEINLIRQRKNPHDSYAIGVEIRGQSAGYVDRVSARIIAPIIDGGAIFEVDDLHVPSTYATSIPVNIWVNYSPVRVVAPIVTNPSVAGVYSINVQGRKEKYVGQARDVNQRIKQHWEGFSLRMHDNPILRDLWSELGGGAFSATLIEAAPAGLGDLALSRWLYGRECHWIDHHRSQGGVFNRVKPEMVLTAAAKAEVAAEAVARTEERKRVLQVARLRYPIVKSELSALASQILGIEAALRDVRGQIRQHSGFRGAIFSNQKDRKSLPFLKQELEDLEKKSFSLSDKRKDLIEEGEKIKRMLYPRRPSKIERNMVDEVSLINYLHKRNR